MGDITRTEDEVARVYPGSQDVAYNVTLAEEVEAGEALYQQANGTYGLADASAAGTAGFRGIALESNVASGVISMLREGVLDGYTLTALDYDAAVYLSDTAGALADAAGTVTLIVGRVISVNDLERTKVLQIDAEYTGPDADPS